MLGAAYMPQRDAKLRPVQDVADCATCCAHIHASGKAAYITGDWLTLHTLHLQDMWTSGDRSNTKHRQV